MSNLSSFVEKKAALVLTPVKRNINEIFNKTKDMLDNIINTMNSSFEPLIESISFVTFHRLIFKNDDEPDAIIV